MSTFAKRTDMIVHQEEPFNAETARGALVEASVTSTSAFFSRNHGPIPQASPESWRLELAGLVDRPLSLSLDELRERFPASEVVATLQCAGNRRKDLLEICDIPGEIAWGPGATGTAIWRGVALADVLRAARVQDAAEFVAFIGADVGPHPQPPEAYGASVPRRKAERPEVLLAWEMNGEPLPAVHGGPLRALVPGYIGARSVKWLERIEVRDQPWEGHFQATAYRLLAPGVKAAPGVGVPLGEIALNSDILTPEDGARVTAGAVEIRGYAFAGGERRVARVDVSTDEGATWIQAEMLEDHGRWAWRLWKARLDLKPGSHEIVVRAWDSAAASQPERPGPLWNPKGYVNNAWGRVRVHAGA